MVLHPVRVVTIVLLGPFRCIHQHRLTRRPRRQHRSQISITYNLIHQHLPLSSPSENIERHRERSGIG